MVIKRKRMTKELKKMKEMESGIMRKEGTERP
jgi:hypothetical protein